MLAADFNLPNADGVVEDATDRTFTDVFEGRIWSKIEISNQSLYVDPGRDAVGEAFCKTPV